MRPGPGAVRSESWFGHGPLWVILPTNDFGEHQPDGKYRLKLAWWRGREGSLTLEGRPVDGKGRADAEVPGGYSAEGMHPTDVVFSRSGCWRITGRLGSATTSIIVAIGARGKHD